jgi:hypothetical protein
MDGRVIPPYKHGPAQFGEAISDEYSPDFGRRTYGDMSQSNSCFVERFANASNRSSADDGIVKEPDGSTT